MTLHHVCESIEAVWRLGFGRFMSDCLCMSVARTYIRSKADRHPWHGRLLAEAWRPDRGWAGARCFTHVGLFDPWTGPDELGSMQGGVQGAQADGKIYLDSRWSNGPWAAHVRSAGPSSKLDEAATPATLCMCTLCRRSL
jgi:hypothetical protein